MRSRLVCLEGLLLISGLGVQAQIPVTAGAPAASSSTAPAAQALATYNQLYELYITQKRRPDEALIARVLNDLKANFREIPDAFLKAGDFYVRIGDPTQAVRQYQEGMAADSSRTVEYQKRVIEVLIQQGKTAEAHELNLDLLHINPRDPEARVLEARFRLDKGEVDAAIAELQSVLTETPNNFGARFNLGRAWVAKGDFEQARQQFESVLKIRPDYMPAQVSLAQLALRQGDPDAALKYAQAAQKLDPNSGVASLLQSAALLRKGEPDEARKLLQRILRASPNQLDTLLELGVLELTQKHYPEAKAAFDKAYAVDPSNLRGLLGIAEIEFQQNEPDKAVRVIAGEVEKHPERRELRKELANAEFRAGKPDQALADYQTALEKYKDVPAEQADFYARMANIYSSRGDTEKAIENMQRATKLTPANVGYISVLAEYYGRAGKSEAALAAYRDALKLEPNNGIVMNNLAYLIIESGGDLDEALALAQHARQQLPKMNEISDTIGWIYIKKNLSDNAIEIFRDLIRKVPDNSTFHYHYGMALVQKGNKAAALEELNAALQYKPNQREENEIKELIRKLS